MENPISGFIGATPGTSFAIINPLVRRYMNDAMACIPPSNISTGCLLTDVGEALVQLTTMMSQLYGDLVHGQHIEGAIDCLVHEINTDSDFSDLARFDYLNQKHRVLKKMLHTMQYASKSLCDEWQTAPRPPPTVVPEPTFYNAVPPLQEALIHGPSIERHPSVYSLNIQSRPFDTWQSMSNISEMEPGRHRTLSVSSCDLASSEDDLAEDNASSSSANMASLKTRGKGRYICKFGDKCDKGGWIDGRPHVFVRNCVYRSHLQKHERPYRCPLPGCPNKEGFARIDQLNRHRTHVKHNKHGT